MGVVRVAFVVALACGALVCRPAPRPPACPESDSRPDVVRVDSGAYREADRLALRGSLVVRVTNIEPPGPILGALVFLRAGDSTIRPSRPPHPAQDRTGLHLFAGLPAGDYVLRAMRVGYRGQRLAVELRPGFTDTVHIAWRGRGMCVSH